MLTHLPNLYTLLRRFEIRHRLNKTLKIQNDAGEKYNKQAWVRKQQSKESGQRMRSTQLFPDCNLIRLKKLSEMNFDQIIWKAKKKKY